MRSWFYWPGTAIIGFVARLLWGARVEGSEHIPSDGPVHPRRRTTASNLDPLILGWAVGNQHRPDDPLHGQGRDAAMAGPRLARDPVGRLLRAARRGGPIRAALRARGAGRRPSDRPPSRRARARATGTSRPASPARPSWPCARAPRCCRRGSPGRIGSSPAARRFRMRAASPSASASRSRSRIVPDGRIDRATLAAGTERIMARSRSCCRRTQRRVR